MLLFGEWKALRVRTCLQFNKDTKTNNNSNNNNNNNNNCLVATSELIHYACIIIQNIYIIIYIYIFYCPIII